MKLKIKIPTSLGDIKLSQYQKFIRTTKDSEDDSFIARQMVGIFCNLPDDVVGMIKAKDYDAIISDLTKVLEQKPKFIQRIRHNGVEYGFIPKLDDITVDEKADLDTYYQDLQKMHLAMGVLYRPIETKFKDTYLIQDYDGKNNKGLDLTLDIVFGANVFFSNLMNALLSSTQNFIEDQVIHNTKVNEILEKNGIGINRTMLSLRETFSSLRKWVS